MPADPPTARPDQPARRGRTDLVTASGALAVLAAAVAGFAWTRPATVPATIPYTQSGHLSYTAAAPAGSVYGRAGVRTGEPVYASAVRALAVAYRYRFEAAVPTRLHGTEQLTATISNGQGIRRTIPLQAARPFSGSGFTTAGTLHLAALAAAARAFGEAAAAGAPGSYPVTVSPSVRVQGQAGTALVHAAFGTPVSFTYTGGLTPGTGTLAPDQGSGPAAVPAGGLPAAASSANPPALSAFSPSAPGALPLPAGRAATLPGGLPVPDARVAALVLLAAALAAGWYFARPLIQEVTSPDERVRIAARHGSSLVESATLPDGPGVAVVQLSSFGGLLQVARKLECPILHLGGDSDLYAVVDNGTLYRYRAGAGAPRPAGSHRGPVSPVPPPRPAASVPPARPAATGPRAAGGPAR